MKLEFISDMKKVKHFSLWKLYQQAFHFVEFYLQ